jgi:dTDP-4-amino-4,6-dideoxygalactose transaminase
MPWTIALSDLDFGPEEQKAVRNVLASKWLSMGEVTVTWDRHRGHASSYDVVDLGFNYRTAEINAALGLAQLRKLPANTQRRRALTEQYHRLLRDIPGVTIPFQTYRGTPAYHLLPVLLKSATVRTQVMHHLALRGIQTSIHYPPIHQFSFYKKLYQISPVSLSKIEAVGSCQMTLPLYADMTENQVDYVCTSVADALQKP